MARRRNIFPIDKREYGLMRSGLGKRGSVLHLEALEELLNDVAEEYQIEQCFIVRICLNGIEQDYKTSLVNLKNWYKATTGQYFKMGVSLVQKDTPEISVNENEAG